MVQRGAGKAENQTLAELLQEIGRDEPAIGETTELTPAELQSLEDKTGSCTLH